MSEVNPCKEDLYLREMKSAKSVRAVSKVDFATFASSQAGEKYIFVYEGVGDKYAYYHWINRINQSLKYEPYIAGNKFSALKLFDSLQADKTGLGDKVYFFVDKDFDGLQGRDNNERIMVTEAYSIENYFVCPAMLDDILKIDFHCEDAAVREKVLQLFDVLYLKFLQITSEINYRIYAARKLKIPQTEDLPEKINKIVTVNIDSVHPSQFGPADLVRLEREPLAEESIICKKEFLQINPKNGYRGKFALLFFAKWLGALRSDRVSDKSLYFSTIPPTPFGIQGSFTLESLAPKAPPPKKLAEFLAQVT